MKKAMVIGFIKSQAFSGLLLLVCSIVALAWVNSSAAASYVVINEIELGFTFLNIHLQESLQGWVNDGLMAIFFLLVGLEIKRELVVGELRVLNKALLPVCAAVGGMVVPALFYLLINYHQPQHLSGWAIPSATDIAFAIGVLSLMGKRVPRPLLIFLSALAIIDDLGAILIIAIFYGQHLAWLNLALSGLCFVALILLNVLRVKRLSCYLVLGAVLWYFMLQSGIHATIAGVLLALAIPVSVKGSDYSPLQRLEHWLHVPVTYIIIPLFVLLNAGVTFEGADFTKSLLSSVTVGVVVGLVLGKCIGIFGVTALMVKCNWVKLSPGIHLRHYFPVSLIAGIGFTMSIFISELAFPNQQALLVQAKLGILCGSFLAAILGYTSMQIMILRKNKDVRY